MQAHQDRTCAGRSHVWRLSLGNIPVEPHRQPWESVKEARKSGATVMSRRDLGLEEEAQNISDPPTLPCPLLVLCAPPPLEFSRCESPVPRTAAFFFGCP